ncbi:hypothetical protein B0H19DRAFT_1062386 [Mycena capillaripes]|nr:hypothetical protein B0H19DRAFT_1062386 [Mycena capillaripes]
MPPYFTDELAFLECATPVNQETDENLLNHQLVTSPLLTYSALEHHVVDFPSRGLLGTSAGDRIYFNTNAPSSTVICGVQGGGKSHTVSCLLECALIPDSRVGQLPEPLSALVRGSPLRGRFSLITGRTWCGPAPCHGPLLTMPLYMHTVLLIIRNMGIDAFSYQEFKRQIGLEQLNPTQKAMIKLRLDLLDAFIHPSAPDIQSYFTAGGLVLVDLTDPFLDGLTAAVLFDIVLGAFTQWQTFCGKLVVLDEAHKYLVNSDSARLTQSISNIIRLQRHLATRVIIATQEPTVVPATILDLASIIICHRFSSPAWCTHLARHVSTSNESADWYREVMLLGTGEALVFSPAAVIDADERGGVVLLGREHIKLRVRPRLTLDGGASLLAVGRSLPVFAGSSTASISALSLPPTPKSDLPAQREVRFGDILTVPSAAAPHPTVASPMTFAPLSAPVNFATGSSVLIPSASSVVQSSASASRVYPVRLKYLVGWLLNNGAANAPLNLHDAHNAVRWMWKEDPGKQEYAGMSNWQRWPQMLQDAVDEGLIELINTDATKKQLKAPGEKMIRLLGRGPFAYDG